MTDVVIVGAARTPIGKLNGAFARLPAHELGKAAIEAALDRAQVETTEVSEVILGQVLTAGAGQNPARQAALGAGIPVTATAYGVNQMCGAGLRAVALGYEALAAGRDGVMVAGGQESMSQAPHCAPLRQGSKLGEVVLLDTVLRDGLTDAFDGEHMGLHTERLAAERGISREQQEAFALASQQKAARAIAEGRFEREIVPVNVGEHRVVHDEYPRPDTSTQSLARLKPAFRKDGTITAGTASGINDGAAAVVLMSAREAERRGLAPLARISGWATAGVEPSRFGLGPVPAARRALAQAGWRVNDLDLVELNEAYAAQSLAVLGELDLDPAKVNVNGGAIALGHPLGASGARVLVTLLHEMARRDVRRGLAALCIGGGMGIAMCVER